MSALATSASERVSFNHLNKKSSDVVKGYQVDNRVQVEDEELEDLPSIPLLYRTER
jgi:non-homologous end joining protein Ku